jgi:hypothetical protein
VRHIPLSTQQYFARIRPSPAAPKGRNTIMPWMAFSHMTDHDLGALWDYLKTLRPIDNTVNPFPDAKVN